MADLRLQVILTALDKVTAPLKKIRAAAAPTSAALKATSDRLKELHIQQDKVGQFREIKNGLKTTSVALRHAQQNAKSVGDQLKQLTAQTSPAAGAVKKLSTEYKKAQTVVDKLKTSYRAKLEVNKQLRTTLQATGISTNNLAAAQTWLKNKIALTNVELASQQKRLAAVAVQQKQMANLRSNYAKTRETAGRLATTGVTSGALGGGLLMGARRFLSPGVDFNEAMSRVQALTQTDKGSTELGGLRQQARHLGATTSYTATEAAQGQGYLAMAGFKPNEILESMPTVLAMAKAGGTDLARTADISSDILTSFGLQSDQMTRVGDVLTMTFTTANTNLEMLGDTMKYVGPIARAAGMSLEQASAMAGLLGNAGIKSTQAGTTLRSMLLRLSAPTTKASKALKELGIASQDVKGNVRDIPTILRDVAEVTKNMGSGQRLGFLKRIFGEEPAAGMAELIDKQGVEGINRYVEIIDNSRGVAAKTAAVMGDNLKGDLLTLTSSWENLGITASDAMDAPLRSITTRIADILRSTSLWMQSNPQLTTTLLTVALTIGAVLAVLGTLALVLATVIVPMAALKMGLGILGLQAVTLAPLLSGIGTAVMWLGNMFAIAGRALLMNPIGLAITAIAVAALLIYTYWEPIREFVIRLWATITSTFHQARITIGTIMNGVWTDIKTVFSTVMNWFSNLPAKFTEFGANLMHGLANGITGALGWVKSTVMGVGENVIGWFKDKLGIHSPSRIFAELGDYTMQGLSMGLKRSEDTPLIQISRIAKRLTQLGAGIAIGAATIPSMAFDTRTPVPARAANSQVIQGDTIHITINPSAGMDEAAIARAVQQLFEQRDRQKYARARSNLSDY